MAYLGRTDLFIVPPLLAVNCVAVARLAALGCIDEVVVFPANAIYEFACVVLFPNTANFGL